MYQPKTISAKEMIPDGDYPVYGANGLIGRYSQFNHAEPQLLITCRGATCGSINVSAPKSWITGNAMVVRPKTGSLNIRFLEYLFRGGLDIAAAITGSAQPQITRTNLNPIVLLYPEDIKEQKRIVAILDEAFEGIDTAIVNAKKNLANARELFNSYLNSVFAYQGERWTEKRLEDTVQKTCSLSYGIVQPGEDVDDGLPIVRPTDLRSKFIRLDGLKRITPALADGYKRTELQGGELLLCVRGGTGSVSIAAGELIGSNVTRGIVPIRFDPRVVIQDFGYFAFLSKNIQDQIRAATYGAALMQINIRDLRKVSLALPPLDIQERLLSVFNSISAKVERLASIYEQKVASLVELKQTILQKAFAGNSNLQSADAMPEAAE